MGKGEPRRFPFFFETHLEDGSCLQGERGKGGGEKKRKTFPRGGCRVCGGSGAERRAARAAAQGRPASGRSRLAAGERRAPSLLASPVASLPAPLSAPPPPSPRRPPQAPALRPWRAPGPTRRAGWRREWEPGPRRPGPRLPLRETYFCFALLHPGGKGFPIVRRPGEPAPSGPAWGGWKMGEGAGARQGLSETWPGLLRPGPFGRLALATIERAVGGHLRPGPAERSHSPRGPGCLETEGLGLPGTHATRPKRARVQGRRSSGWPRKAGGEWGAAPHCQRVQSPLGVRAARERRGAQFCGAQAAGVGTGRRVGPPEVALPGQAGSPPSRPPVTPCSGSAYPNALPRVSTFPQSVPGRGARARAPRRPRGLVSGGKLALRLPARPRPAALQSPTAL